MTRVWVHTVDTAAMEAYSRAVDGGVQTPVSARTPSTAKPRRRRRPHSPEAIARERAGAMPWANLWKEIKAAGRWR